MSLGGDDGTKHDIYSSMERLSDNFPSSTCFTIHNASTSVSTDGPSLEVIASPVCCGAKVGEMWISGFVFRQSEVQTRDCRHVSCWTFYLERAGEGRGDGCHATDSSSHAITKVSRIIDASAVLIMSINKGVNEAHHLDSMQEASQEYLGDQVMEKMASPWKHSCMSPQRGKKFYKRGHSL